MNTLEDREDAEFQTDVYRGRSIAILRRHQRWHVYLDHVLQHNVVFGSGEHAIAWLMDRVDRKIPARLN
jgi:hypothetical protein